MISLLLIFVFCSLVSGGIMLVSGENPKVVAGIIAATFIPFVVLAMILIPGLFI